MSPFEENDPPLWLVFFSLEKRLWHFLPVDTLSKLFLASWGWEFKVTCCRCCLFSQTTLLAVRAQALEEDFVADGESLAQFLILWMKHGVFLSGKTCKAAGHPDGKNELEALLREGRFRANL